MKSCPTCNRTFEDTFTFCLADGSLLNAPFDPQATQTIPESRQTEPPPTEVLKLEETKQEIPPTIASPKIEQKQEESVSTIVAPAPAFESPEIKDTSAPPALKPSRSPLIMVGVGALLMLGLILLINSNRSGSTTENAANINTVTANATNTATVATVSNSNQTRNMATPSPSPSPTPVINLEGTVWQVMYRVDSKGDEREGAFEFKQSGRIIYRHIRLGDGSWEYAVEGTWTRQGDKLLLTFRKRGLYIPYKLEATIQGEEMSAHYNDRGNWPDYSFKARLIK